MKKKLTINNNTLFYISLIFFEISNMFTYVYGVRNLCGIFSDIAIFLLLICCIFQSKSYSIKSIIIILFLICIFSINAYIINDKRFLFLLLMCLACKNIELNKVIDFNWKCQFVFLIIVLSAYFLGFTENYYMYRSNGVIRSSMGFSHPNAFGIYIFSICCQFIFCKYKKLNIFQIFPIIATAFFIIYKFSDSRGSAYSLILIFMFVVIVKFREKSIVPPKIVGKFLTILPILLAGVSLYTAHIYNKNDADMYKLNMNLSGRISAAQRVMKQYDIMVWGQKLELTSTKEAIQLGTNAFVLDNAYIKLIYQYGIIVSALFTCIYCLTIKKALKNKDYILVCMLIIYLIRGLTENIMFNVYGNIFLLFFSKIIYGDDKNVTKNQKQNN